MTPAGATAELKNHPDRSKTRKRGATRPGVSEGLIEEIKEVVSDRLFWIIVVASFVVLTFFIHVFNVVLFFPFAIILAFAMTHMVRKQTSLLGSIYYGGGSKSEEEGLSEFTVNFFLDKALSCERKEQYEDAVEYLKAAIEEDETGEIHLEARYKIARLYHKKLNQPLKAIDEYKNFLTSVPEDHPLKRDAYERIQELTQLDAVRV